MRNMTVRLDDKQARLLDAVAQIDNKPAVQVVREALDQHISQRFQDPGFRYRIQQAAEEIARLVDEA